MTDDALDPNIVALQQLLASRSALGLEKHGVTTAAAGLSHTEWLQHTMLELLDGAIYIMSALRGRDDAAPIPMVLFCPFCGTRHVDAADPANGWTDPLIALTFAIPAARHGDQLTYRRPVSRAW